MTHETAPVPGDFVNSRASGSVVEAWVAFCFAGDPDPGLTRVVPDPVWTQTAWAEVHIAIAKAPRMRAVTDFLREMFAEEADLLAGNCSA